MTPERLDELIHLARAAILAEAGKPASQKRTAEPASVERLAVVAVMAIADAVETMIEQGLATGLETGRDIARKLKEECAAEQRYAAEHGQVVLGYRSLTAEIIERYITAHLSETENRISALQARRRGAAAKG